MPTVTEILETMSYGPTADSTAEVTAWLTRITVAPDAGPAVLNPATGALLAHVAAMPAERVGTAIAAARDLGVAPRGPMLRAIAALIQTQAAFFAVLQCLETGRPIRHCAADVAQAARIFRHHATLPPSFGAGVTGAVIQGGTIADLARHVAPALARGHGVVVAPTPPLTARALADRMAEAGLPGLLQVLTGDLAEDLATAGPDTLTVFGPTGLGRAMRRLTAGQDLALTLDLEDSPPFVVLNDADLDAAAQGVADGIPNGLRVIVAEAVLSPFLTRVTARLGRLRSGDLLDRGTDLPLSGAPLRQVDPADPVWSAPLTGPGALLTTFRTPEEAIALANNSRYAKSASVWSEGLTTATAVATALRAGAVTLNSLTPEAVLTADPAGDSGFAPPSDAAPARAMPEADPAGLDAPAEPQSALDATARLWIGGAWKRADSGQSYRQGDSLLPLGSRKDIRNAVEAARKASAWSALTTAARAEVMGRIADLLAATDDIRDLAQQIAARTDAATGATDVSPRGLALTYDAPLGVIGIACQSHSPRIGFAALALPAIAAGNRIVVIPAPDAGPVLALAQILAVSDLPAGVVNIVTGPREDLAMTLAAHDDVDALWYCGTPAGRTRVEAASADSLKPVWCPVPQDWSAAPVAQTLARARRRRSLWLPQGL